MNTILILQILIGVIIFIMVILGLVYLRLIMPKKQKKEEPTAIINPYDEQKKEDKKVENYGRFQGDLTQESIFNFMEFDEVIDSMIVRKNKTQYVMILQCNGVNYDLMSEQEKISVEEGFVQFLNTLRFPIQLYVQSRTLNLKDIIAGYKERVEVVKSDLEKLDLKIIQAQKANNKALKEKLEFEKRRKQNVLGYGLDITDYVEKLNSNKNILQQRTYVVVSFFVSELGGNLENYSKEEIDNMCFSELYTRCQNLSASLANSQVTSRILDSEEIAELLYIAYNRDESEVYRLNQALDAQYDALYSSGKDVLIKKQEQLDKEINIAAIDLATDSILRADKQKQIEDLEREKSKTDKIKEKANELLDQYENQLNSRVYEIAKDNIQKSGLEEKEEKSKKNEENKTETNVEKKTVSKSGDVRKTTKVVKKSATTVATSTTPTKTKQVVKKKIVKKDNAEE